MRDFFSRTIFLFHVVFVAFWYSLFLIPESLFSNKVSFHFYLTLAVILHQFSWGFLIMPWTGKYRMVCLLTTINQLIRGQKISDPKNYDHSFTREVLLKIGINIPHKATTFITFTILTFVTIRYFF